MVPMRILHVITIATLLFSMDVGIQAFAKGPAASAAPEFYNHKATWAETMIASRAGYTRWYNQLPAQVGPWYMSNVRATGLLEDAFLQGSVDTQARDSAGELLWQELPRQKYSDSYKMLWATGADIIYFHAIITADKQITLPVSVGCNRSIEVFLNGEQLLERKNARMPPRAETVEFNLKRGPNVVILKAFNTNPKTIDFHFALWKNPAVALWAQLEEDFPLQSTRMIYDLGQGEYLKWFENDQNLTIEQQLVRHVTDELGTTGASLQRQFEKQLPTVAGPQDPRYLEMYVTATRIRAMVRDIEKVNFRAIRMAVEDLGKTYPDQYRQTAEFLLLADRYEKQLPEIYRTLSTGTDAALRQSAEFRETITAFQRDALLSNPLLDFDELLVIKRKPMGNPYWFEEPSKGVGQFIGMPRQSSWQIDEMSNIYDWENEIARVSLTEPGADISTVYRSSGNKLLTDMDLHFDGGRILFSMPDDKRMWQLHEIDLQTGQRRQITGEQPDVHSMDACYLPNGQIAFISSAIFQGVPCNLSISVGMLYRMDGDGTNIRQFAYDQDHDYHPTVMNDGRLLYLRWEYTDIPHVWARFLFTANPDGTAQRQFFGSGSYWPNAIFYAKPVPNHPTKVVGIVTGHHVSRVGELVVFDPARGRNSAEGAVQRIPGYGKKVEPVVTDRLTMDTYPKFLHPFPLSENYILVSCRPTREDMWGIYLVDTFDNMVLIKEVENYALLEPIPFRKTVAPPVIAETTIPDQDDAVVYIENIYSGQGMQGVPKGVVKSLRLFTYHFAYRPVAGIANRVGVDGPWEPKRILGTVPVEADGSALFRIPAKTPLSIQPLDADGKALQLMRSWMTAMPGEFVSCVGCHDDQNAAPPNRRTIALSKKPEEIQPWYGPERGFSFKREVQPVLDNNCVSCHNGSDTAVPDFRRDQGKYIAYKNGFPEGIEISGVPLEKLLTQYNGVFSPSYIALRRYVRVGGLESDLQVLTPGEFHADNSELFQILNKGHYGVELNSEETERFAAWIDLNAPAHGTWHEVVGWDKIANDHKRRQELQALYGRVEDDPEAIYETMSGSVKPPQPLPAHDANQKAPSVEGWPFDAREAKVRQNSLGQTHQVMTLGGAIKLEIVRIPAGRFVMGDATGHAVDQPLGSVTVTNDFWMSKFEVTNELYALFDPTHDSRFEHKGSWQFDAWDIGWDLNRSRQPVVRISQQKAMAFCRWLSEKTGFSVTLPTEAEWEYACRAGSDAAFSYGNANTDFSEYANLADWSIRELVYDVRNNHPPDLVPRDARFNDQHLVSSDVGSYKANAWGLHDMHGNVWEWTRTKLQSYPYRESDGRNNISETDDIVIRGGSWYDRPQRSRAGYRLSYPAWRKVYNVGFRVVLKDVEEEKLSLGSND